MPYYQDALNNLHFLDNASHEHLLPKGCVQIADSQVHALREPTKDQVLDQFAVAVQAHMDTRAREMGYDSLLSAVSYADEPSVPKFRAEGMAFRAWRSQVWAACHVLLDKVQRGEVAIPSIDQLIAQLPELGA